MSKLGWIPLFLLLLGGCVATREQSDTRRDEADGLGQVVKGLIAAFDGADILALGEQHWRKADSDLRIRLIQHPDFARKVRFIVVEFASTGSQSVLDRYIRGDDVPAAELAQVWRNTTQTNGVWESPVYAEFFKAVRAVNGKLKADQKIRVLAVDPPAGSGIGRNESAVDVLKREVLDQRSKALVVYGSSHLYRAGKGVGGITKAIQSIDPSRIFVVSVLGGTSPEYRKFEAAVKTPARPVLVSLKETPFRDFSAEDFLSGDNKMLVDGVWVPAPVYQGLTMGEVADACVYLGMSPESETRVEP